MQSTTETVAAWSDVPGAAARYLHAHNLPRSGSVWPGLATLDWHGAGLAMEGRGARGDDLVGITGVFAAIAETGTLMVASGPASPAATSLLPETHIAVVPVTRIVAHMEDGWDLLRAELGQMPRAVNFISGPSRTGDIDQTIVLGAHGPYRVHMILVAESAGR
jgi:L-lactate dehydrogenase complex protein LldG